MADDQPRIVVSSEFATAIAVLNQHLRDGLTELAAALARRDG